MTPSHPSARPPLLADAVDVWLVRPSQVPDEVVHGYRAQLPADERDKCDRFTFAEGKRTCLITRALIRTTLARYFDHPADSFIIETSEHGRPFLPDGQLDPTPSFNLSHTHGLIACALSFAGDVGVDVEWRSRRTQTERVARRSFSATDLADLEALPSADRHRRFFDYWTLKEAYLKARGFGLSVPLERFSFHLGRDATRSSSPTCTFAPDLEASAQPWWFRLEDPGVEHTLAVALCRHDPTQTLTLRVSETIPSF